MKLKNVFELRSNVLLCIVTYNCLCGQCPFAPWWCETDPPSAPEPCGSAAPTLSRSGTSRLKLQTAPERRKKACVKIFPAKWDRAVKCQWPLLLILLLWWCELTMCTAWLYRSFSAESSLKWSMSFCLSSRNASSRRLRERQCLTQLLYISFSFRTSAQEMEQASTLHFYYQHKPIAPNATEMIMIFFLEAGVNVWNILFLMKSAEV